ncbi:MAG: methionine ABC transporter ATP-binding protein [Propionibacteriaceae bacterium]|nr:methionine ABC transporter ATP-binding protein [Propionibacteriaceae bacterium]
MIEARGLTKTYQARSGVVQALDGVDLTIPDGEITAVVGHSGAGKTTFGRCVNLLERPTGGSLAIDGIDVEHLTNRERIATAQSIGTVFQGSRLLMRRTALENVMFPLGLAGLPRPIRRRRAEELLERVGLADKRDAYPRQLSGGQAQRVGIARALALSPGVLISDEATSGLDPATTDSILALIRSINAEDALTVVLITHEMDVVRAIADRVVLMESGRVVEQGRVDDLLVDPDSRLGAHLLPLRAGGTVRSGLAVFSVTYQRLDVPADWLVTASELLGAPLSLLAGSVEQLSGGSVGRLTIGVPEAVAGRAAVVLGGLGLRADHFIPAEHPAAATPPAGPAAPVAGRADRERVLVAR